MINSLIILSDIHGNLSALNAVIKDFEARNYQPDAIAILGDIINYGMRPNEVIGRLKELSTKYRIDVNLFGNHEKALIDGDTSHFSTERGKQVLDYTRSKLTQESLGYIKELTTEGFIEKEIGGKEILFVHGSIVDPFWGKLNPETADDLQYSRYDYVISGHSHIPHLFEYLYPTENPEYRNKKRTIFLNPGSVGQPRNHNPKAQYLYIDIGSEIFQYNSVSYDIEFERSLFNDEVNRFYSDRLINGI